MSPTTNSPRLIDVARRAGVSPASVSRVINQTGPVSEALRAQVEAAMSELGYEPKRMVASTPPLLSEHTLALLIMDTVNPFFHEIAEGAQQEADRDGLFCVLINTTADPTYQQRILDTLSQHRLEAVIACGTTLSPQTWIDFYERTHVPLVVMNLRVSHPEIYSIVVNFESAARRAAQHLLDLGHTRIGYLGGPAGAEHSHQRLRGIELALAERGLKMLPHWRPETVQSMEGAFQGMSNILDLPPDDRPTAVVVYNDFLALGALNAIRAHGLRVPDDISIVSFDDIPIAAHTNPPLTTIAVPKARMGRIAVRWLRQQLRSGGSPKGGYSQLESPLIVRESTAPVTRRVN
ncbi:MAG: LacI family transcriptional regulator [Thermoflexales bacterium]|nr:LacI family transcriptional regulator [Thermoflexales bacterium]